MFRPQASLSDCSSPLVSVPPCRQARSRSRAVWTLADAAVVVAELHEISLFDRPGEVRDRLGLPLEREQADAAVVGVADEFRVRLDRLREVVDGLLVALEGHRRDAHPLVECVERDRSAVEREQPLAGLERGLEILLRVVVRHELLEAQSLIVAVDDRALKVQNRLRVPGQLRLARGAQEVRGRLQGIRDRLAVLPARALSGSVASVSFSCSASRIRSRPEPPPRLRRVGTEVGPPLPEIHVEAASASS